jgi:hypothetical protein
MDGPQPDAALAAMAKAVEKLPPELQVVWEAAAAQDARFSTSVEFYDSLGILVFTKGNKHVSELHPEKLYLSYTVLLKVVGAILSRIDAGPAVGADA